MGRLELLALTAIVLLLVLPAAGVGPVRQGLLEILGHLGVVSEEESVPVPQVAGEPGDHESGPGVHPPGNRPQPQRSSPWVAEERVAPDPSLHLERPSGIPMGETKATVASKPIGLNTPDADLKDDKDKEGKKKKEKEKKKEPPSPAPTPAPKQPPARAADSPPKAEADSANTAAEPAEDAVHAPKTDVLIYGTKWDKITRRTGDTKDGKTKGEKRESEIREKLKRKVSFEFVDTPLDQAIAFLRGLARVTMIVDPRAFDAGKPKINLRVKDMQLELALEWLLRPAGMRYAVRSQAIYIARKSAMRGDIELRIYDVSDLTALLVAPGRTPRDAGSEDRTKDGDTGETNRKPREREAARATTQAIAEMIRRVGRDSWAAEDGTSIEARGGRLVVMQWPEVHKVIDGLLSRLREAARKRAARATERRFKQKKLVVLLDHAKALFEAGQYKAAKALARRILQADPTNAEATAIEATSRVRAGTVESRRDEGPAGAPAPQPASVGGTEIRTRSERESTASEAHIQRLTDKDPAVRENAAEMLGLLGATKAVPHLIEALRDNKGHIMVQIKAHGALNKITGKNFGYKNHKRWEDWWVKNRKDVLQKAKSRGPQQATGSVVAPDIPVRKNPVKKEDSDERPWKRSWASGKAELKKGAFAKAKILLERAAREASGERVFDPRIYRDLSLTYYGLDMHHSAWWAIRQVRSAGYDLDPDFVKKVRDAAAAQGLDPTKGNATRVPKGQGVGNGVGDR